MFEKERVTGPVRRRRRRSRRCGRRRRRRGRGGGRRGRLLAVCVLHLKETERERGSSFGILV